MYHVKCMVYLFGISRNNRTGNGNAAPYGKMHLQSGAYPAFRCPRYWKKYRLTHVFISNVFWRQIKLHREIKNGNFSPEDDENKFFHDAKGEENNFSSWIPIFGQMIVALLLILHIRFFLSSLFLSNGLCKNQHIGPSCTVNGCECAFSHRGGEHVWFGQMLWSLQMSLGCKVSCCLSDAFLRMDFCFKIRGG